MMLIDREDVIRLGLGDHLAFQTIWEIGSPEAVAADYADVLAPGPFLFMANDEDAWAGQNGRLRHVAQKRADPTNLRRWRALADIYAEEIGISRQGLVLRFASMRRRLHAEPGWVPWDEIYHWPEGSDLVWSSLSVEGRHVIKTRVHAGEREASR